MRSLVLPCVTRYLILYSLKKVTSYNISTQLILKGYRTLLNIFKKRLNIQAKNVRVRMLVILADNLLFLAQWDSSLHR
jgi:hypothetical protein